MFSPSTQKLIDLFSRFPGVGQKSAARFVFYLLEKPTSEVKELLEAVANFKKSVRLCSFCASSFEPQKGEVFCPLCRDSRRDRTMLCLVEKEADLLLLEQTKKYQGLYFVLGGLISPLQKREKEKLLLEEFWKRIKRLGVKNIKEIILAVSPTVEGEATCLYLERVLKTLNLKITRLGVGLPRGAEIEYADQETLSSAFEARRNA